MTFASPTPPVASDESVVPHERLHIRLLGPPEVLWRGQSVTLARRQTRALLFRLVASSQPVQREALFALLWPDVPQSIARRQLTVLLNHLRRELPIPNVIDTSDGAVGLRRDAVWTDVAAVEAMLGPALARRTVDALESVVAQLRGPFLQGFALTASPDFDLWLAQEREAWQRRTLDVLTALTDAYTGGRDYAAAITTAQRYLQLDGLAEDMHRRLMGLFAASGDRASALRQFDACADTLERELDVSPLPETWALWESIRAGTAEAIEVTDSASRRSKAPPLTIRATVPAPPNPLIGRETEVAAAQAALHDPTIRLLTLIGPGGSGKTRLALEVARSVQSIVPDGVAFVPLAHLRDSALVLDEIARALGLREQTQQPLAEALRDHLRDRQVLLVLDNVEHVLSASTGIAELMSHAPQLRVLVTSRTALRLAGEHLLHVRPLPLPDPSQEFDVQRLSAQPALALLLARVNAHSPKFQITPANAVGLIGICTRLDGLPLAIELAAARLKMLSPAALLERLDAQHALLINGPADLPERQQTLRATIDWSYGLLDDSARRALSRLAVFAGGWTLEAAEAVCQGDSLQALDTLLDNSLIERAHAGNRFDMLTTIRTYALERLDLHGADEVRATTQAHHDYFRDFAQRAASHLRGVDQAPWLQQLDDEHANLLVALDASEDFGDVTPLPLASALGDYWLLRGLLREGRHHLARALALPTQPQDRAALTNRAQAHQASGYLAMAQGDFADAREQFRQAVAIWRSLDQKHKLAFALLLFSGASGLSDDFTTANEAHAEGHQLAVALADADALALVHMTNGLDARNHGDYDVARPLMQASLAHVRRQGDAINLLQVLLELIPISLAVDGVQTAQAVANEAVALSRRLRNQPMLALALNNLGECARAEGRMDRAAVCYARALQLMQASGNINDVPRLHHNQACVALHRGQFTQAATLFRQSLLEFQALHMDRGVAECVAGMARLGAAQGRPQQAATLWGAAEIAREGNRWGVWPADQADHGRYLALARAASDAEAFERAWQDGRALSLEQAAELMTDVSPAGFGMEASADLTRSAEALIPGPGNL